MSDNYKDRLKHTNNETKEKNNCCILPQIKNIGGNWVCLNCGMTFGRKYVNNERRQYNKQEINERKQNEPRWREVGARTFITNVRHDAKGKYLSPNRKRLFIRLSKVQNSLISSIERNFWEANPRLKMLCTKLNIPSAIKETAWKIYKKCAEKKLTMGRSIIAFISASLYAAIRIHEFPKVMDEIAEGAIIPRRDVSSALSLVVREVLQELGLKYKPITPHQLIYKFGNELNLPMDIQKQAINILNVAISNGLPSCGKDPKGIAASTLYFASKSTPYKKTQSEISNIAKVTEVTLRSRGKDIENHL